jgi:ABC-type transporter lipoprotein component MlaA
LGGLFDPATHWKIGRSDEDFGKTLGHYGSGPGFYFVLPVAEPSNGRDALGKVVDLPMDVFFWLGFAYSHEYWPDLPNPAVGFNDSLQLRPSAANSHCDPVAP